MLVLMNVITRSELPELRWSAALYLRQGIVKHWAALANAQPAIQSALLEQVVREPEPNARKALAEAIATVAQVSLPAGTWPELLPTVVQFVHDAELEHRRTATRILRSLAETLGQSLATQFDQLAPLLRTGLTDADLEVRVGALHATGQMVLLIDTPEAGALMRELIPHMMAVVEACLEAGLEDETCAALEPLADLVESPLRLLHGDALPHLIEFLLRIHSSPLPTQIRTSAIGIAEFVSRCETKRVVKLGLVQPIVASVFQMLAEPPEGDDDDDDEVHNALSTYSMACHLIDELCREIPVQVVLPICIEHVQAYAVGTPLQRRAMLGALGVMSEGCGEEMSAQLTELLPMVLAHLQHGEPSVRLAAFVCVALFSEHLVPQILDHTDDVVPALLNGLSESTRRVRDACIFALRNFVDNMSEQDAAKWVGPTTERLLAMMTAAPADDHTAHELIMTALCASCNVGKEHFSPYIEPTLQIVYRAMQLEDDDAPGAMGFRAQATETASIILCVLERAAAEPHVGPLFELAFAGMELGDHELCAATHSFFGNAASMLKADMDPLLDKVMGYTITALLLESPAFDGDLEHSDSEGDDDEFAGTADYEDEDGREVGSGALLLHQTAAARSVGQVALFVGAPFGRHLDAAIRALCQVLGHRYHDLRSEALTSLCQLCLYMHRMFPPAQPWTKGPGANSPIHADTQAVATLVFPFAIGGILGDHVSKNASKAALALKELLDELGPAALEPYLARIVTAISAIMRGKGKCQVAVDAHDDSDDLESGRDIELFDACWDVLISCANCLGDGFEPFLRTSFVPQLLKFVHPKYPGGFGGLALGALHDMFVAVGGDMSASAPVLLDACVFGLQAEHEMLKVNAAVLAGLVVANGGAPAQARVLDVLTGLQPFFAGGPNISDLGFDNACGAIGRIIGAMPTQLPLAQLLPVWLGSMPVREDNQERNNALRGLLTLAERNGAALLPHAGDVARLAAYELANETVEAELRQGLAQLVGAFAQHEQAGALVQQAMQALDEPQRAVLQQCLGRN